MIKWLFLIIKHLNNHIKWLLMIFMPHQEHSKAHLFSLRVHSGKEEKTDRTIWWHEYDLC